METPKISIASVTYRDVAQTERFIDSVYATASLPLEFIIVNNGSSELDVPLDMQCNMHPGLKVIRNVSNLGIGIAMEQAMRACKTDYIFRADSDVRLLSPGWDKEMCSYVDRFSEVGAVGTSITGGNFTPRRGALVSRSPSGQTPNTNGLLLSEGVGYIETDLCLSNFMLIHRRAIDAIAAKSLCELPRVQKKVSEILSFGKSRWDGYFTQLGGLVNYMTYHAGFWENTYQYGADDFSYSMWIRFAGLRIAKAPKAQVYHKDDSLRPEWSEERHRRVNLGFQQWRAEWEVLEDFFDVKSLDWDCWPMNKQYKEEQARVIKEQLHF